MSGRVFGMSSPLLGSVGPKYCARGLSVLAVAVLAAACTEMPTATGPGEAQPMAGVIVDGSIGVAVDIKPQSCPNAFNPKSRGVTPLAILGTDDFDVRQIDPGSVRLGGVSARSSRLKDASTPAGSGDGCTTHGRDGYTDLVMHFDTRELARSLDDVSKGDVLSLRVTGQLKDVFGGTAILGSDNLLVVNTRKRSAPQELFLPDDGYEAVDLGFTFRFQGQTWDAVYVNSNGSLTFGSGDSDYTESVGGFLNGRPRIAALWDDLNPAAGGAVYVERARSNGKNRAVTVRFVDVPEYFDGGSNSFSITLKANNQFELAYGSMTALDGLAGVTEGGGVVDPGETDLSAIRPPLRVGGTTYEVFSGDFDLSDTMLPFKRGGGSVDQSLGDSELLALGDDDFEVVALGFDFEFQGAVWNRVHVNSNGSLTFGAGDRNYVENVAGFLSGPPRIAAFWDDLNPAAGGAVRVIRSRSGRGRIKSVTVQFEYVPEFPNSGSNTFSITLRRKGEFDVEYGVLSASDGLVGATEGVGAPDPGETNLSASGVTLPAVGTVYELFTGGFDLAERTLTFSPKARRGRQGAGPASSNRVRALTRGQGGLVVQMAMRTLRG